jgi:restriction system protein
MDREEGVLLLLQLVAEKGPGKRSDFLPEFTEFCHRETTARTDNVIKSALYDRLRNLLERGYIRRRGPRYEVTEEGLAYLQRYAQGVSVSRERQADIRKLAQTLNKEAREQLNEYLLQMDPIRFEELIKLLLEEMGYDNVETTAPTNDKGVDVVADIELGISSVREVVQVKRRRGTVGRRILDQLRGSLHRFNAVRGTIITTGRFSRGTEQAAFEPGASPITLIDGEKLLDLLFEHNIGVARRAVEYYEFTPEKLAQFEGTEEITETGEMEA